MIPAASVALGDIHVGDQPGKTYRLDIASGRIRGMTDGIEALRQTVYLILSAERYRYPIYSWDHGVELADLIGKPHELVLPEVERAITEALMQDDRISGVDDFDFVRTDRHRLRVTFTVHSTVGDTDAETEVRTDV